MADTQRKLADLQTLLADNTTKQISPQDLRDALVTTLGAYGSIHCNDGSASQSVGTSTKVVVNQFTANGAASGVTPDHANDKLTVGIAGDYFVSCVMSFASNGSDDTFEARILKGGAEVNGLSGKVEHALAADENQVVITGILDDLAANDIITVQIEHDNVGAVTFDVKQANLCMKLWG